VAPIGKSVTVVGLGLLGSALARALVDNGYGLTVWNRSPERAAPFAGSAVIASSLVDACEASEVIIVCLINPAASEASLCTPDVESVLSGKVIVQLTTTAPADARREAEWAGRWGADYLDGAVMGAPSTIGTSRAKALFSGPRQVFDRHRGLLDAIAPNSVFCGEDIGRASLLDHALLEVRYGCLAVVFHAMALCASESVPFEELFAHVSLFADGALGRATEGIGSGAYPTGNATMVTFASWAEQLVRVAEDAEVDTNLPAALLDSITRTVDLGHGQDDYQALFEAFRKHDNSAVNEG
jgi:3-hydroxyisobutyrate dehydrogenase-like beta-hydroxyacid dehydrogenase